MNKKEELEIKIEGLKLLADKTADAVCAKLGHEHYGPCEDYENSWMEVYNKFGVESLYNQLNKMF